MSNETPVPETLETIAQKITALGKSIDQQLAEVKAQLGVKIEAVEEKVNRVYDVVIAQREINTANMKAHEGFTARLENHEIRILALEPHKSSDL